MRRYSLPNRNCKKIGESKRGERWTRGGDFAFLSTGTKPPAPYTDGRKD